jgi:hypothetical protein
MADYDAVYKLLFDGLMDAIGDIEKQNYRAARLTLLKARQAAGDILLAAGDTDSPVLRRLTQPDDGAVS